MENNKKMKSAERNIHAAKNTRDKYQFPEVNYGIGGKLVIKNIHDSRLIATTMNLHRDILHFPEQTVKSGEIYAISLINQIFQYIIFAYIKQTKKDIFPEAVDYVISEMSQPETLKVFDLYLKEFPVRTVYSGKTSHQEYFKKLDKLKDFPDIVQEIILLWLANQNPAFSNYVDLFLDKEIEKNSHYPKLIQNLHTFFDQKPGMGSGSLNLIDLLRAPALASPNSIQGQLDFIKDHWGTLIGDLYYQILSSLDFIKEEEKSSEFGPGPMEVVKYDQIEDRDKENFSLDRDWMPSLVLIAKNAFVWLDQLSKKYQKPIQKLDQIPDQELDNLKDRGFSGLWLIGLWERSRSSARIKQLCGNPEAIASAYSLSKYQIADQLGGESAYQHLKERAWNRGIRMASDMVPNHMGIDSDWVYDHPDWFINLNNSPFPSYSYNGENLSSVAHVDIRIEDHYYDRSDAAVVFKYQNHTSGSTKYIYHGNDGTTMPWNDTAQLNYLIPEVREAVYQTILSVARRFPIIRFDAAMTLAKKHFHRLWYPEPGSGGAIPSRAEFGLTKNQFDKLMPYEFWREVVDRLAVDAPDTLLLAEAFWLMESYFVRTLGMHRVYNSAFMIMLRDEDNAKYRQIIINTLNFDPQILKRFVNFMNNPDEKTAAEQFGKGDKYFGICTIMSTLPGLPMFGHGQIEGFTEKYGMEYKKAYWDEIVDENFVERHNFQIFPILNRRWMFSEVENFKFYNFHISNDAVNVNVYVYSNFVAGQSSLVIYNNKFADTYGWIQHSIAPGINETIFQALHLDESFDFVIYRDIISNLEFITLLADLKQNGFQFELQAYQTKVMVDFHLINDDQWHSYRQLESYLNGSGVPSIDEALKELLLQPVQIPLKEILNIGYFEFLLSNRLNKSNRYLSPAILNEAHLKSEDLFKGIFALTGMMQHKENVFSRISDNLEFILSIPNLSNKFPYPTSKIYNSSLNYLNVILENKNDIWAILLTYAFLSPLGFLATSKDAYFQSQSWYHEFHFSNVLLEYLNQIGIPESKKPLILRTMPLIIGMTGWYRDYTLLGKSQWIKNNIVKQDVQQFLNINRYQDILWFNQDRFEILLEWMYILGFIEIGTKPKNSANKFVEESINLNQEINALSIIVKNSEFRIDKLLANLEVNKNNS